MEKLQRAGQRRVTASWPILHSFSMFTVVAALALFLVVAPQARAQTGYVEVDSYLNPQTVITLGTSGYSTAAADDTSVFQQAIDDVASGGGGRVVVPRGTYDLTTVNLKSEVHLVFQGQSQIRPYTIGLNPDRNLNLFDLGDSGPAVRNVSVRGINSWSRFEFDRSQHDRVRAFRVADAQNFLISNFNFEDSRTTFSGVSVGWSGDTQADGNPVVPVGGTVEHLRSSNAHYGYGAIQIQGGKEIVFSDIESVGGVGLRIETGFKALNQAYGAEATRASTVANVHAENISSHHGQAAYFLSPHTLHQGAVTATGISSVGSEFAVLIDDGSTHKFTQEEIDELVLTQGTFESISIDGVNATYSPGPIETRFVHLDRYPEELRELINLLPEGTYDHRQRGPSIAPVVNSRFGDADVSVNNVSSSGFDFHPDIISQTDFSLTPRGQIATPGISLAGRLLGDINDDEVWTSADLDLLYDNIGSTLTGGMFDILNNDGVVNSDDIDYWLRGILGSEYGDADLDGRVSFQDIEIVAANFNQSGDWADGDFNGDGIVNQTDLDILERFYAPHVADEQLSFQESLIRVNLTAVPEPGSGCLIGLTLSILAVRRRR